MNHTSNRDQNLQNTTSSTVGVIDLTKENPSNATNAYYSISLPKKRETTIESTDIRPQKRIRKEPVQFHPSIPNILNKLPLPGTQKNIDSRIAPTLYLNNTIIPTSTTQISNGRQTIVIPNNTTILPSPSNYSQYVSQNYNNIKHSEPYNIGLMKSAISQIPPQQSVQPVVPISSSNSTASSSNASQEIIDLTNDSDDNDCIIDEKETNRNLCWGMINTEFLVLYPRPCPSEKGPEKVQLERCMAKGQVQIRVMKDNISFGVIDQELAIVLNPLIDEKLIRMEAKIPENSPHSDMRLPLHLILYGSPCHTNIVSKHLADRGVILTDTEDYNKETRFLNPHNAPPGNVYLNRNIQKVYKGYSGGSIGTTTRSSEEIKNKMNKVFNSLMTAENIPELEPDSRLITPLYKHQKQALYFLTKKEQYNDFTDDQTNELMSLWRTRTSAGRHTSYYNVVTNEEVTKKPAHMRGGIIADDMGLGKTIQMIALILGTKHEAIEFAAEESTISSSSSSSLNPSDSISSSPSILNKTLSSNESPNKNLRSRGTLIICPLSTVSNWEEQFASHVSEGALSIYVYHGGARISDPSHLINYDVVITTYNVTGTEYSKQSKPKNQQSKKNAVDSGESAASSPANRPINLFNSPANSPASSPAPISFTPSALQQIHWFRIILDEAHIIKDDKTIQSMAACSLEAERRWCLTGTPIQNKVEDLFALIKFLHMDPFSIKEKWRKYILHPIKSINPDGISRLQTLMKCITLRRTKTINGKPLLSLPPRNDHIRYLDLNDYETKLYKKLHNSQTERMRLYERENNMMQHYVNILQSLLRLRQICAHYSLVKESDMPEDLEQEIVNEGLTPTRALMLLRLIKDSGIDQCGSCLQEELVGNVVVTRCEHLFCMECANKNMSKLLVSTNATTSSDDKRVSENCPICGLKLFFGDICEVNDSKDFENDHITRPEDEKKAHSTKVKALIEDLVQAKEDGVKSVVFSQWTKMLDLIEDALNEYDIKFTRLDGTMSRVERTQNMNTFKRQDNVNVILVSLKAGGVGLNLTAAQRAYLMDPFWNPSVENQAIDRIHRLGQTCPVDTIRFIIRGSVEENILELQKRKLRLAELTLSEKLSKQDMIRHRLEDLKILFK